MAVKTESVVAAENFTWLGSTHGIRNARTVTVDPSKFSGKVQGKVIPAGTPVTVADGVASAYAGTGKFSGFLLTDVPADGGKVGGPVLDHGRVIVAKVPGGFTPPAAADDETTFVYVK